MEDVTEKLLKEHGLGRDPIGQRLLKAKAAKAPDMKLIEDLRDPRADVTMGFVSAPLVFSSFIRYQSAAKQNAIFKMLKGGYLVIVQHLKKPPEGSYAYRDTRYGDRYYELAMNPAKF